MRTIGSNGVIVAELCAPPDYIMAELVPQRPRKSARRVLVAGLLLGGLAVSTGILFAALQENESVPKPDEYEVEVVCDLAYVEGTEADAKKHKLDLYLPQGKKDFPVVLFVHGGAWSSGDRNFFGAYEAIGKMFARHGVGAAIISYRLSPSVKHPEHIKDVARAFAWTKQHIAEHGGRPDQLFVCGHSAGGHLTALLATDESYLQAVGCSLADVRGAMPMSGVYTIPDKLFTKVFGEDPAVHASASPRRHVRPGCPPFLIVYAAKDFPYCDQASEEFARALRDQQVPADTLKVDDRNHINLITRTPDADDPCGRALLAFVAKHASSGDGSDAADAGD
ncbi:MAG TPA: alpha/beta hydrolase [Pirellulales bacterium]|nr:alpha/beta hydrolase [Pirellulales bacterium]